ncbi:MAG: DRTGG domain-containing protein [Bacteroidales bacterium]
MIVADLVKQLNLKVISGESGLKNKVEGGYTSDLLSDVMGFAESGQVWITVQTHKNVMAVASLKEMAAIILVKGLQADPDTLEQSDLEGIPILSTHDQTFEMSGKLYSLIHVK